ncbi:hypothetical protein AMECASPLE_028721 [Ameca splendens]|uniref:Uncharacterized protein n=1 Tax=Ameca splendens TaxID=208324 RepID=A0ABV0YTY0_9TELE
MQSCSKLKVHNVVREGFVPLRAEYKAPLHSLQARTRTDKHKNTTPCTQRHLFSYFKMLFHSYTTYQQSIAAYKFPLTGYRTNFSSSKSSSIEYVEWSGSDRSSYEKLLSLLQTTPTNPNQGFSYSQKNICHDLFGKIF